MLEINLTISYSTESLSFKWTDCKLLVLSNQQTFSFRQRKSTFIYIRDTAFSDLYHKPIIRTV